MKEHVHSKKKNANLESFPQDRQEFVNNFLRREDKSGTQRN